MLCRSNGTSVRFSTPFSTDSFAAQAYLELRGVGVYELGEVRLTYCLPTSGLCTGADIPVYSFQTGGNTIAVREYRCFSDPDYWFWEAIPAVWAAAFLARRGRAGG